MPDHPLRTSPEGIRQREMIMTTFTWEGADVTIKVDHEKCTGSGECVASCPSEVYELQDEKSVPVNINECIECCTCVEVCPENAIIHSSCE